MLPSEHTAPAAVVAVQYPDPINTLNLSYLISVTQHNTTLFLFTIIYHGYVLFAVGRHFTIFDLSTNVFHPHRLVTPHSHALYIPPNTVFYLGKKSKPKMGAGESMKFLAASPYIRDLAALVVGYGMAINIVEVRMRGRGRVTSTALFCF
jgi:TLC ATP/ADP transporter